MVQDLNRVEWKAGRARSNGHQEARFVRGGHDGDDPEIAQDIVVEFAGKNTFKGSGHLTTKLEGLPAVGGPSGVAAIVRPSVSVGRTWMSRSRWFPGHRDSIAFPGRKTEVIEEVGKTERKTRADTAIDRALGFTLLFNLPSGCL